MTDKKDELYKSFTVHVPAEIIKSTRKNDQGEDEEEWIIGGIASTPDVDLQGEEVIQEGLDISALEAGRGIFNHDHQKGPENVLGEIDGAEFTEFNGKKALRVRGYLFKHQPRAQAYYNIMKSIRKGGKARVHFSIEGKVLDRDMTQTSRIKKARVTKVALTLDPVNPMTFADLVKSMTDYDQPEVKDSDLGNDTKHPVKHPDTSFELRDHDAMGANMRKELEKTQAELIKSIEKMFEKAIAAGAGYADAPASRTGGSAMQSESLDRKAKKMLANKIKNNKKMAKAMLKSLTEAFLESNPKADPLEVTKMICKSYELKLKEFLNVD